MNQGFTYQILLNVQGQSAIGAAVDAMDRLDARFASIESHTLRCANAMERFGQRAGGSVDSLVSKVGSLIAAIGGTAAVVDSLKTAATFEGMERSIAFTSGSTQEAQKNFAFLDATIEHFGLSKEKAYNGFQALSGGVMGAGVSADETRHIFDSVAKATTVLGINAENTNGIFLALSQMASKGTVSAEELRGQMGERMYGAFALAAQGMGVTTSQLGELMKKGDVMAKDFLPKFAKQLDKTFGSQAELALNSATANFNRFETAVFDLKVMFGEQLMPSVLQFLQGYIIPGIKWIGEHRQQIADLVGVGIAMAATFKAMQAASWLYSTAQGIAAIATGSTTATVLGLNAAFWLSPITWIAGAVIALGGAVYYAYTHFETFRGVVGGVSYVLGWLGEKVYWAWTKLIGFVSGIYTVVKPAFDFFGGLIYDHMIKPLVKVMELLGKVYSYFADVTGISAKFNEGYNNSIAGGGVQKTDAITSAFGGGSSLGGAGGGGSNKNDTIKQGIEGITGGGKKTTHITININKMLDGGFTVITQNVEAGADALADMVLRKLTQTLNSANQVQ